ncbi:MAG: UDP-N-acetylmuramate dehydrogenase [Patescibacteria group bacterium]
MNFQKNVFLKNYSSYKIGGAARLFAEVGSVGELIQALRLSFDKLRIAQAFGSETQARRGKIAILGGGTNLLISDRGFDGLVIHNKIGGILRLRSGQVEEVKVGSGVAVKDLLDFCIENSLSGLEWAGGLPGTVGGAVRGNAGAFGGEIRDNVCEVESLDPETLEKKVRKEKECGFNYRESIWKTGFGEKEIITFVSLKFEKGNKEDIQAAITEKIKYRKARHPLEYPNIGSIFKNVPFESLPSNLKKEFGQYVKNDPFPVVPTAKIIFLSGLKGRRIGGAMVSDKHTNFIVNVGNAKAEDVKQLIILEKQTVKDKFGISIEEEIVYLGD